MVLPVLIAGALFLFLHGIFGASSYRAIGGKFPQKVWQTWKTDAAGLDPKDAVRVRTWTMKNPKHRYELLTDDNALSYVQHHYGPYGINRPDIVHVFETLNAKIIKADLLRYLVMYIEGGVYADIDVECLKPIEHFIPNRYDEKDIDMVIGIETDMPDFKDHPVLGQKSQSFCQWTFMGKARLPVMMRLIENIMAWLNGVSKKQNKPISQIELDFDEVLIGTGPSAFTSAVLAEMSAKTGNSVTWDQFSGMLDSKVVAGVLVLPSESFAAGTGHSASGNHDGKSALIKHHFHASSWPTNHPRFKHPVYGEVERCNWDPECVKLWDSNTAFFNSLPEEEQLKLVHMKETEDKKHPLMVDAQGPIGGMAPAAGMPPAPAADLPAAGMPPVPAAALPLGDVPLPEAAPADELALPAKDVGDKDSKKKDTDDKKKEAKPLPEEEPKIKDEKDSPLKNSEEEQSLAKDLKAKDVKGRDS
jgi:mannosyltransferase OCH1-like enzyme